MTEWGMRRPPRADEELARWTLAGAPELQLMRSALQRVVMDQPSVTDRESLAESLTIVATELAGNALRHCRPPTVVILQRADGHLVVAVQDNDSATAPAPDGDRAPGEGGLGLVLAQRLAHDVGWCRTATGKRVWASFSLVAGPSEPAGADPVVYRTGRSGHKPSHRA